MISSITNLVHELETQPSAQSSFQKLNVDNSCKKNTQIKILHFWSLVQFYCISWACAKYFASDCRGSHRIFLAKLLWKDFKETMLTQVFTAVSRFWKQCELNEKSALFQPYLIKLQSSREKVSISTLPLQTSALWHIVRVFYL